MARDGESGADQPQSPQLSGMPLAVFDIKGYPGRRERIEAALRKWVRPEPIFIAANLWK
jgi:hypothetical protein